MNSIIVKEKSDDESWNDISMVLHQAHHANIGNGIVMKHQNFNGEEIADFLGDEGHVFVAIHEKKVVGTVAFKPKETKFWFGFDLFSYCCFEGVIPQFMGNGVYHSLVQIRERYIASKGIDKLYFNTHPRNKRVINISIRSGYKLVKYTKSKYYSYVYLVKWLNGCPYSDFRCKYEYLKSKFFALIKYYIKFAIGKRG